MNLAVFELFLCLLRGKQNEINEENVTQTRFGDEF